MPYYPVDGLLVFEFDEVDGYKVMEAAELLHEAGVQFDTGAGNRPINDEMVSGVFWNLDYSLEGATLYERLPDEEL